MREPYKQSTASELQHLPKVKPLQAFASIHVALEKLARVAVWLGGIALLLSAVIVTLDVLSRKIFGVTMSGSDEISGYVFAASTTMAYSYCVIHRANIRIDAFYNFLPLWMRSFLDIVGLGLLLLFMGMLTWSAIEVLQTSWAQNSMSVTTLSIPLWIPQSFWVAGLVLFVITATFLLLYAIVALSKGDTMLVKSIVGTMSVEEEISEETKGMDIKTQPHDGDN
jgi:TRAP-type C4-dicarboxylate transport system permease small subunit